jgi:para-nitrobenzyl esterase
MKPRHSQQLALLPAVLFAAVVLCSMPLVVRAQEQKPVVFTFSGPVRGSVTSAGVREFLGIPYAAPPVGNLRWRPPVPHAPWFAPLEATQFANHCPQPPSPFGSASVTEDCLFLNVFTPDSNDFFRPRAVMVWIHGGALVFGESNDYDPTALVRDGVIVVTMNYRLGVLGFLAHSAFAGETTDPDRDRDSDPNSTGDYGLMDQQLALRWVRDNIRFFGGDPLNVTIFGESAGGLSVFSQLASPSSESLFQKAIIESGAYALNTQTLAAAEAAGTAFAAAAGCNAQTAACLRALPVTTLLANEDFAGYTPNIDGDFFPLSLNTALATGQFHHVPVIQGSNHDEWRLFTALDFDLTSAGPIPNNEAAYEAALATLVGPAAPIFRCLSSSRSPRMSSATRMRRRIFCLRCRSRTPRPTLPSFNISLLCPSLCRGSRSMPNNCNSRAPCSTIGATSPNLETPMVPECPSGRNSTRALAIFNR